MSRANCLLLPLGFLSLALLAGCGNNNNVSPNNNGYSNSDLSGTYVFSFSGTDANVNALTMSYFAVAGTITADGKGNITGGTIDINDANLGAPGVFTGQALSASTYSISQDGRGTATLATPEGNLGVDFVLTSDSHGLISRFDNGGSGSGTFDIQGSATQGSLTSLAFSLFGSDPNFNSVGTVGAFALNSSGTITSGVQDFNDNNSSAGISDLALNGSLVLTSGTTGTASLDTSFASLTFDVWVIDSTHLKLIETDTTSGLALAGDVFPQQTSFTAGQVVFTLAGADSAGNALAAGGFATTDANGNLSAGLEDYNDVGATNTVSPFTASCNATAPFTNDRCQLATNAFSNNSNANLTFAAYPSTGGVLLLEDDSLGYLQGAAYAQSATAFGVPANFGLNLSGVNANGQNNGTNGEVDDIGQFNSTSTNLTGVLDENDLVSALISTSLSGTYTPDSPADGRGAINVNTPGTFIGGLGLEYYVVDSSNTVFIEMDSAQLSTGVFELQSTPGAAVAQARKATRNSVTAPAILSMIHSAGKLRFQPKHPGN